MGDKKLRYNEIYISPEDKEKIKDLYLSGNSTVKIGQLFGFSHKKVARVLEELCIPRTGVGRRKYQLDECYFDKIDTPNKAYILGFLCADGSNNRDKNTVSMTLEEGDFDILEKIRKEIKSERELDFLDYSNKHNFGYTYKNQYRLLLFSSHICDSLIAHGVVPNKSLILEFPEIEKELLHHFIRGVFDGDGSVYQGKRKTQFTLTITSTDLFCNTLKCIVEESIGINCHVYDASNHNGITKVFTISGRNQVKKFMDWMYNGADLFLQRKYDRYLNYFYNINNSLSD